MNPEVGNTIEYNNLKLVKILSKTDRTEVWEMENRKNLRFVCKFIKLEYYPAIQEMVKKNVNIDIINEAIKNSEIDYNNSKKINGFKYKVKNYATKYSPKYNMIYVITNRFDENLNKYTDKSSIFLIRFLEILKELHLNFYTSNNIWPNDIMYNVDDPDFYLVDYKNLTFFGQKFTNLEEQNNDFLSLNIIKGGVPTIFDDLESLLYVYCFLNKIPFPTFNNLETQIQLKTELNFLPEIIRQAIFVFRTYENIECLIDYSDELQNDFIQYINDTYDYIFNNMITIITENVSEVNIPIDIKLTDEETKSILPSEAAFLLKIKNDAFNYGIRQDAIDSFSNHVVNFVLRNQEYDDAINGQILDFLQVTIQN